MQGIWLHPGERGGTLHPLQRTKSQNFSSWRKISVLGAAIIILITEGNEQRSWQTTYLIYEYVNNESTSTILFYSTRVVDWVPIDPSPTYSIPILLLFRRASPGVCEIMLRCSRHYHAIISITRYDCQGNRPKYWAYKTKKERLDATMILLTLTDHEGEGDIIN